MVEPELERLRRELAGVDRDLLARVARRQALASESGRVKRRARRPRRDDAQEKEVVERARRLARELGLARA